MFDNRLSSKVIKVSLSLYQETGVKLTPTQVVDVSYGGENGFNQAIDLAAGLAPLNYVNGIVANQMDRNTQ